MPSAQLKRVLQKILSVLDCEHPEISQNEISLLFCDDTFIQVLNADYRGKNKPTDVLSFSAIEEQSDFLVGDVLGDLVISIPTAKRQAKTYHVSLEDELYRLIIHGVLHLFGYDHEGVSQKEARKMRVMEQQLLAVIKKK